MSYVKRCSECGSLDLREYDEFLKCHDCDQLYEPELVKIVSRTVTQTEGYVISVVYIISMILNLLLPHPLLPMFIFTSVYIFLYFAFGQKSILQSDKIPADWGFNILACAVFGLFGIALYGSITLLALFWVWELLIGLVIATGALLAALLAGFKVNFEMSIR